MFIFLLVISSLFLLNSFSIEIPIKSIEIGSEQLDFNNGEPGSWKVTKSASWIGKNKAKIVFDISSIEKINNAKNDVIFVIDTSDSMTNADFSIISTAVKSVLNSLNGKAALINFNDSANIISEFTDDFALIYNSIGSFSLYGNTNYYQALVKVDEVLNSYSHDNDNLVSVVFLTDGYPTSDTPNEIAQYKYLKKKYNYLDIRAIQYNIGNTIFNSIKNISDKQFWADSSNINEILYKSVFDISYYEEFKIVDSVNTTNFTIDNATSDFGKVSIKDNRVSWIINNLISGGNTSMTINITLNEDYQESFSLKETNIDETITSKLDDIIENVTSTLTPILSNNYIITYDSNAPSNCQVSNMPSEEKHFVYDTVALSDTIPTCLGYKFKEWEIMTNGVEKINDDNFIMPEENVTVRAIWSNVELNKSANGTISEQATLYKVLQKEATSGGLAKEYTGAHQDSVDGSGNRKIYYFSGSSSSDKSSILDKNNVIFANMCWEMFRTTDTGGVKMIYNGEPDADGTCKSDRGTHPGYVNRTTSNLSGNYYYGTDYTYDTSSKSFKLSGNLVQDKWTADNYNDFIGKYTCRQTTSTGTCATLYYVESYYNATTAYVFSINGNSAYYLFGTMSFNANRGSPASVGYMYNNVYQNNRKGAYTETILKTTSISTTYYYAESIKYENGKYILDSPSNISSTKDAVGKYTFRSTSETASNTSVYYIEKVVDSTMYYIELTDGHNLEYYDNLYTYGDSYTKNDDGTYTITNPSTIKVTDWYNTYSKTIKKYLCKNPIDNTCSDIFFVATADKTKFTYIKSTDIYKFASGFTYSNGTYKLNDDTVSFWDLSLADNITALSKHQYTCFNESDTCEKINFVYFSSNYYKELYYIILENGKSNDDALKEMFYADDLNKKNSTIKTAVDAWYKKYLSSYTNYLEASVFCNYRVFDKLNGWEKNGNVTEYQLTFKSAPSLACSNITDMFSTKNEKAKLDYPVAIISRNERSYIYDDKKYWTMSPVSFNYEVALTYDSSTTFGTIVNNNLGVRPVISLKAGTSYLSGDGSMNTPYIVDAIGK